jgi:large subunit ribosomal protein L18
MARGPRYRIPMRRRAEGNTNYHKRLKLLKSRKLRLVIRASNKHIIAQIVKSTLKGDQILAAAYSKELNSKFGWKTNSGNMPTAYLTGYLIGIRGKNLKLDEMILDLGLFYHRNRVLAVVKGVLDAGLEVPHRDTFFPDNIEERVKGKHIEEYAKKLKEEQPEKYETFFSGYLNKNKVNPLKFNQLFNNMLKTIENKA